MIALPITANEWYFLHLYAVHKPRKIYMDSMIHLWFLAPDWFHHHERCRPFPHIHQHSSSFPAPVVHLGDRVTFHSVPQLAAHHLWAPALEAGEDSMGFNPWHGSFIFPKAGDLLLLPGHLQLALLLEHLGLGARWKVGEIFGCSAYLWLNVAECCRGSWCFGADLPCEVHYCSSLEEVAFQRKSAEYLWMLVCGAGAVQCVTLLTWLLFLSEQHAATHLCSWEVWFCCSPTCLGASAPWRWSDRKKRRCTECLAVSSLACWHSALACQHSRAQHSLQCIFPGVHPSRYVYLDLDSGCFNWNRKNALEWR